MLDNELVHSDAAERGEAKACALEHVHANMGLIVCLCHIPNIRQNGLKVNMSYVRHYRQHQRWE
jgi:hypothetical protein